MQVERQPRLATLESAICFLALSKAARSCLRNVQINKVNNLAVWSVGVNTVLQLLLPLVAVCQQFLLVVQQLLPGGSRVLHVGTLDNGVHRARLLAVATVDALGHVDIVLVCSSRPVDSLLGLDGDGLGRADGLTQFTSNASFFSQRVSSQSVFTSETRRNGALLVRVVYGVGGPEEHLQTNVHASSDFVQKEKFGGFRERTLAQLFPSLWSGCSESLRPHRLSRPSGGQVLRRGVGHRWLGESGRCGKTT